jgi:hypothetical protein
MTAMQRRTHILLLVLLALGLGSFSVAAAASQSFDLEIRNGTIVGTTTSLRVQQGDEVTLHWRSDTPLSLHVHGYDLEQAVAPDAPGELRFTAYAAGRFPITMHGDGQHEAVLVYLEVLP